MRVLLFTGSHPRHLYFASEILKNYDVCGIIKEEREGFVPQPPENITVLDKENFIKHFVNRERAESKYFKNEFKDLIKNIEVRSVSYKELNISDTALFVNKCKPDITFIFGTGLIKEPLFCTLPEYKINLHLGLSPWYKGAATLFWPFYNLQPQFAGTTFHIITPCIDAGPIISQCVPVLSYGDGIHDVSAKAVVESAREAMKILEHFRKFNKLNLHFQKKTGSLYLVSDFHPSHLRVIYNLFKDKIVDEFLNKNILQKVPSLIKF